MFKDVITLGLSARPAAASPSTAIALVLGHADGSEAANEMPSSPLAVKFASTVARVATKAIVTGPVGG